MHFSADTGVREKLLNIHETNSVVINLVLARTVTKHPTGYRDLAVVNWESTVAIVDRQGDFSTSKGCFGRSSGKDDVFHFAAAENLCPLLPHHPSERIEYIRLPGAVRTDNGTNSGFESESRCRSKGLETFEGQTLEIHEVDSTWFGQGASGNWDSRYVSGHPTLWRPKECRIDHTVLQPYRKSAKNEQNTPVHQQY